MATKRSNSVTTSFEELTLSNLINKISEGKSDGVKKLISCLPPTQRIPAYTILLECEVKATSLPETLPDTESQTNITLASFNPLNGCVSYNYTRVGERVYNNTTDKYETRPCEPRECTDSCDFDTWVEGRLRA